MGLSLPAGAEVCCATLSLAVETMCALQIHVKSRNDEQNDEDGLEFGVIM